MPGQIPASVIAAAQAAQKKWGVLASVTIAQWAVESAWGRHMPAGSNNPFGIKSTPGHPFVIAATREVYAGKSTAVQAAFRKFDSLDEAFDAHGELLATKGAYAKARKVITDPKAFASALTGVYATDPNYGRTLISVMDANDLYRFDKPALPVVGLATPALAVLAPAGLLAVHTHSHLLPIVLGVSLALAIAWVVITYLKGHHPMSQTAPGAALVASIDALAEAIKTKDDAANHGEVAALQGQLTQAQADLASAQAALVQEQQDHADDIAAANDKIAALTPAP